MGANHDSFRFRSAQLITPGGVEGGQGGGGEGGDGGGDGGGGEQRSVNPVFPFVHRPQLRGNAGEGGGCAWTSIGGCKMTEG